MANEITERGQFATYGGPQLTLAGSDLAGKVDSILTRSGTGTGRGWAIFDSSSPFNSLTVIRPGDMVLVNPKTTPMDFPLQATGSGGSAGPKPYDIDGRTAVAGSTEFLGSWPGDGDDLGFDAASTATVAFSQGSGTVQLSFNQGATWQNIGNGLAVPANSLMRLRVLHAAGATFFATITFAF